MTSPCQPRPSPGSRSKSTRLPYKRSAHPVTRDVMVQREDRAGKRVARAFDNVISREKHAALRVSLWRVLEIARQREGRHSALNEGDSPSKINALPRWK